MNNDSIFCRRATVEDAAAIAQVHVASWQVAYKELLPADLLAGLSVARRQRIWERILQSDAQWPTVFVAGIGETISGFISVAPARGVDPLLNWGEVEAIYVDGAVWGRGVGYRLMQTGCEFLRESDCETLALWVLDGNVRAATFYERFGFVRDTSKQGVKLEQMGDYPVREHRYLLKT